MKGSDNRVSNILTSKPKSFLVKKDDESEVDGVNILARVEGPAFFPGEVGGNGRYYPLEVWLSKLTCPDLQHRIENRTMYGAIGHEVEINDDTLRQGLVSHIVSKIWYDEDTNVGMAEYLVLGTESGKILNTLLRAGSKLSVSTLTSGIEKENEDGTIEILERDFDFDRIDFVIEPSYKKAVPTLRESQETKSTNIKSEGTQMDQNNELQVKLARAEMQLQAYAELGSVRTLTESQSKLSEFEKISETPTELSSAMSESASALEKANVEIEKLRETVEELSQNQITEEDLEKLKAVSDYTHEDVKTMMEQAMNSQKANEYLKELTEQVEYLQGTLQETQSKLNEYLEVTDGATPQELTDLFEAIEDRIEADQIESVATLAAELNVPETSIQTLLDKGMSLEEAGEFLRGLSPAPSDLGESEEDQKEDDAELDETEEDDEEEVELEGSVSLGESLNTGLLRKLALARRLGESQEQPTQSATVGKVSSLAESLVSNHIGGARRSTNARY